MSELGSKRDRNSYACLVNEVIECQCVYIAFLCIYNGTMFQMYWNVCVYIYIVRLHHSIFSESDWFCLIFRQWQLKDRHEQ